MSGVTLRLADHVATVTIDRPDVLNAIDLATEAELQRIWSELERDDSRSCSSRRPSQCSRVSLAKRSRKIWCSSALFFTCCS